MRTRSEVCVFWFRRDLRLEDNTGLYHALKSGIPVLPLFIFDKTILELLSDKRDRRVDYIHQALRVIHTDLQKYQSGMMTGFGTPLEVFRSLEEDFEIRGVFCNRDYEPDAISRDAEVAEFCEERNIPFRSHKDQVIFDRSEIVKNDGTPYTVYTPYSKKWKGTLTPEAYRATDPDFGNFHKMEFPKIHSLDEIGFKKTGVIYETPILDALMIEEYDQYRDYPALQCTTRLGIALRFGTVSVRKCVAFASEHNEIWLNELIWREFFMQILYHFPHVVHRAFRQEYDHIEWRNDEEEFRKWCEGKTGYPMVDAGMRQLNETGYMHNRARMVTASFLCKHLLIDWRWGEAYFAGRLDDYDLAANNGNWQWAAGCGCDAAPYFRIFNPTRQAERFDKDGEYARRWIPERGTDKYPDPIVDHRYARERALRVYGEALKERKGVD